MKLTIFSPAPYKWEMEIKDLDGKTIHTCKDSQKVLNTKVKFYGRLKKRKGIYTVDIDLKELNFINKL